MSPQTPLPAKLALVAAGGTIGTALRAAVALAFEPANLLATLLVNVVGAFALAQLAAMLLPALGGQPSSKQQNLNLFFGTGLLGGFTTYSTFAFDSASLYLAGGPGYLSRDLPLALTYGGLALALGALATGAGLWVGAKWRKARQS